MNEAPATGLIIASPAHGPAMAAIHEDSFPVGARWGASAMALQLILPGTFGFLEPDGFILARVAADEAEILTLAVVPTARRTGLASRLLRAALLRAVAEGACRVLLEVAEDNMAGRSLYTGMGFGQVGRRRGYYGAGADALVLRWDAPGATSVA